MPHLPALPPQVQYALFHALPPHPLAPPTTPPRSPQVQYGYVNLEEIFRDSTHMSASALTSLLVAKIAATSLCVGGGLVRGAGGG